MSGNLCRCGAYEGIVAAIEEVAPKMGGSSHGQLHLRPRRVVAEALGHR